MKPFFQMSIVVVFGLIVRIAHAQTTRPSSMTPSEFVQKLKAQIAAGENQITAPAAYEHAAKALAMLCQSDPFFFRDEPSFAPAWTPPEILKLNPTWVQINPDRADVEFGGGFHHFGYELKRDPAADTEKLNGWTLEFRSEDSPNKLLKNFTLNKTDHVEAAQFVSEALAEFKRRASLSSNSERSVNERLIFLLKFNEVELARASIHDCAAASADDWADQLLAYIIDAKTARTASARLDSWAQKRGDWSAWILAAYAYGIAGDDNALERCTKLALAKPVDEPEWLANNARYRAMPVILQLLKARRYPTCAALCDAILSYGDGDFWVAQITAIRDRARHAAASEAPPAPPAFDDGDLFQPFKGIELARLIVTPAATQSSASSQASKPTTDSKQARMIEYLDHRIAADPNSHRNYTDKIGYLHSIKRDTDILSTCKAAAIAFPKWWRPQMTLAVLADADSRKGAETAFRKWTESNPAFIHWWYVCRFCRDQHQDAAAVEALRTAIKYPLESVDDDESWVPAAFAFDAASYAYEQKQYALVLDIARVWSSPRGVYNYFDDDIYAFRAAGELALGQFSPAKADADKAVKAASQHALWTAHLSELQKAAHTEDRHFKYIPGSSGADWSLFPDP